MFVGCKSPIARCGVYERAVNNFLGASRNSFPKVNDRLITRGELSHHPIELVEPAENRNPAQPLTPIRR